jgi:hypothetical protein
MTEACREATEVCEGKTEAFPEKRKSAPEETKAVEKSQEVRNGATDEETIGAAQDRTRELHLPVGCRGQLKTRTKRDGGLRQEYAAIVGRPTRRTVPATCKRKLRRGPGKKCRSGIQGQSKAFRNGKRGRIEKRERRLERKKTHREVVRQSLRLEIAKLLVESSIGLREPGHGLLWKCRPPPKRKR